VSEKYSTFAEKFVTKKIVMGNGIDLVIFRDKLGTETF